MTFPEQLPDMAPTSDADPDSSGELALARSQLKVFRIGAPLATHFEQVDCVTISCPESLYGFRVKCDTNTELGQQQVAYIQASGRTFISWWEEDGKVTFLFNQGQNGFTRHWRRLTSTGNYVVIDGDGAPVVLGMGQWLTALGTQLNGLRDTQSTLGSRLTRVPTLNRDETSVVPPLGYGLTIGGIQIGNRVTSINLTMPLDANDSSRPMRLATLADFNLIVEGLRDISIEPTYRRLVNIIDRELSVSLQVGQWFLSMRVLFARISLYRSATDAVAWRLVGKLNVTSRTIR